MIVLVTGDRNWDDEEAIWRRLSILPENTVLVHGACRGLDSIADFVGSRLGFKIRSELADWKRHGRQAGPIRNRRMYDIYKPNLVLAFHRDISRSRGTKDMIRYALRKNANIELFTGSEVIVDQNRIRQLVK